MTQCILTVGQELKIPFQIIPCGFCGEPVTVIHYAREIFICDAIGGAPEDYPGHPPLMLTRHQCELTTIPFPVPPEATADDLLSIQENGST